MVKVIITMIFVFSGGVVVSRLLSNLKQALNNNLFYDVVTLLAYIFFITVLSFSNPLKAEELKRIPRKEIYLKVIHIDSETSMTAEKAYSILQDVSSYYTNNTDIKLLPGGFLSIKDPRPQFNKLSDYERFRLRAKKLWFYITKHKLAHKFRKREIILIIDRALEEKGLLIYSGGASDVCSLYCAVCYSYMHGNSNSSLKIAIHEVGHALGVKGHEAKTIMDIAIPNFILGNYAKKRISGCNRKTTKRKVFMCRRKKFKRRCLRRFKLILR